MPYDEDGFHLPGRPTGERRDTFDLEKAMDAAIEQNAARQKRAIRQRRNDREKERKRTAERTNELTEVSRQHEAPWGEER